MPKFEYCNLSIAFQSNKIVTYLPNGDTKITTDDCLLNIINNLGKEEWELVSVIYLAEMAGTFYFKRELKNV